MLMSQEHHGNPVLHEQGLQPVAFLLVPVEAVPVVLAFPLLGIKRMMDKDELVPLLGTCEDLFQPFELLAGDLLVLSLDIGIEHHEERVSRRKGIIDLIHGKVHLLPVDLLASRHFWMDIMVADGEEVWYGHGLRHLPEIRPHLAVARLFDLVAGVHDEERLPLHDLADDLPVDVIARPVVADHGKGEFRRKLFERGKLLLKRLVLRGEYGACPDKQKDDRDASFVTPHSALRIPH